MVKNTHGGSGHKKFARKHTSGAKSNKLRISEDEGEIYAIVTKMLGFRQEPLDRPQPFYYERTKSLPKELFLTVYYYGSCCAISQ